LIIWVGCGLVSLLGALCYAEIGTVIPRSGAEAAYLKEGIGSIHKRTGDILAYLLIWTTIFVSKPSSIAILTLTFSRYFLSGIMDGNISFDDIYCFDKLFIFRLWTSSTTRENDGNFRDLCVYNF